MKSHLPHVIIPPLLKSAVTGLAHASGSGGVDTPAGGWEGMYSGLAVDHSRFHSISKKKERDETMTTYQKIMETQSGQISLTLPESLVNQRVEVTIRPVEEPEQTDWPIDFINQFWGCIPDFPEIESEGPLEEVEDIF